MQLCRLQCFLFLFLCGYSCLRGPSQSVVECCTSSTWVLYIFFCWSSFHSMIPQKYFYSRQPRHEPHHVSMYAEPEGVLGFMWMWKEHDLAIGEMCRESDICGGVLCTFCVSLNGPFAVGASSSWGCCTHTNWNYDKRCPICPPPIKSILKNVPSLSVGCDRSMI